MPSPLRAKILVLSDSIVRGERQDASGQAVRELLTAHGWNVTGFEVLPDDVEAIRQRLLTWTESEDCDAVFTTGGM